ncbi:uncharacterized protein LOC130452083 [Diorhabda sublineata]|uniref:uncharacterized protein LOC130452083 n=1 Tax=Diorhabda sublineata TaxID=1163346 RepID=UPI0024E12868|nr:uncharacterized protein LOC130452083 [Diorhabda sublineata]
MHKFYFEILAILATTRAAFIPSNLPLGFQYQNVKPNPFGSSQAPFNGGFFSTSTPAPIELNSAFASSTPSPLDSAFVSSTSSPLDSAFVSSTPSPVDSAFVSSTPSPLDTAFVSSSSSPLGFNNEFLSSGIDGNAFESIISSTPKPTIFSSTLNGLNGEFVSSTPAPAILNQNFNSFFLPNTSNGFLSGNGFESIISSTPNPSILSSTFNLDGLNSEFVSSTQSPLPLNQYLNQFDRSSIGVPQFLAQQNFDTVSIDNIDSGLPQGFFDTQSQRPEVEKNVYFFAAPEEPEPVKPRVYFEDDKKNVNLIFIKAPAAPSLGTIEITPPKKESPEKTVVYVLVKKPEDHQNIVVKSPPAVTPNKPEVVFIKYKNDQEAQHAITRVQAQQKANLQNLQFGREYITNGALLGQSVIPGFSTTTESTFSTLGNVVTQGPRVQSLPDIGVNYGQGLIQSQSLFKPEYISNGGILQQQSIIPGFSTTTESTLGNEVTQGLRGQLPLQSLANLRLNYDQIQSVPKSDYISNGAVLQQSVIPGFSTTTESALGNDVTRGTFQSLSNLSQQSVVSSFGTSTESPIESAVSQSTVKSFTDLGLNYGINSAPLVYSTPRPQVEINAISNNAIDNFVSIGGRQSHSDLIEQSTIAPVVQSSSISPCGSSTQSPISFSTTLSPSITSLNPFYKKK